MQAISVIMRPKQLSLSDESLSDIVDQGLNQSYQDIYNSFKSWVDRNIILNVCDDQTYNGNFIETTYFALSEENASTFINEFSDNSTGFCIKQFWEDRDHEVTLTQYECIDFDNTDASNSVVGNPYVIWDWSFPVSIDSIRG